MDTKDLAQHGIHYLPIPLKEGLTTSVLISGGEHPTMVDTGLRSSVDTFTLPWIIRHGLQESIWSIINTHCHIDHCGGNSALRERIQSVIAAHYLEETFIEDRSAQFNHFFKSLLSIGRHAPTYQQFLEAGGEGTQLDIRLHDGDTVPFGDRSLQVIHTPGHTAGSICLYDGTEGLLITGDAIQGLGTSDTLVPLIVDIPAYLASIDRLASLKVNMAILSHQFYPGQQAILAGNEFSGFLEISRHALLTLIDWVESFIQRQEGPFTLQEATERLVKAYQLAHENVFEYLLVSALLQEMITRGELVFKGSGTRWGPNERFEKSTNS